MLYSSLLLLSPRAAHAQDEARAQDDGSEADEFAEAERLLDEASPPSQPTYVIGPTPAPTSPAPTSPAPTSPAPVAAIRDQPGVWALDDGAGDEIEWNDFDPHGSYYPRGGLHFGVELNLGYVVSENTATQQRPQVEVHGYVDLRYSHRSPWRLRLGVVLGAQPFHTTHLGGGAVVTTSVFSARVRLLPLSVDFGSNFGLRAGGDIGFQIVPGGASPVVPAGGPVAQVVGRTDDGSLEIGAYTMMVLTGVDRAGRQPAMFSGSPAPGWQLVPEAAIGINAGYLF